MDDIFVRVRITTFNIVGWITLMWLYALIRFIHFLFEYLNKYIAMHIFLYKEKNHKYYNNYNAIC